VLVEYAKAAPEDILVRTGTRRSSAIIAFDNPASTRHISGGAIEHAPMWAQRTSPEFADRLPLVRPSG
jgi:hypothetical protein